MEAQGYHITDNIVNQDNQSNMLLSRNRKDSSGKRTKHINIRYFFVTDLITNEDFSWILSDRWHAWWFIHHTYSCITISKTFKLIINLWKDNIYRYDKKRSHECVVSTDPTYEQRTHGSLTHPESRIWSDVVHGHYGIRPVPSMTQDGLRTGPSKYHTQVGTRPD